LHPGAVSTFETDGFLILPGVISDTTVSKLADSMTRVGARHGLRNLLRDVGEVAALAKDLKRVVDPVLGAGAFGVRGIFFDKLPEANWEVSWHQDLGIAVAERIEVPEFSGWSIKQGVPHVQPPARILERMATVRVHLDDCGSDNGPLRIVRGSHRGGRLDDVAVQHWTQSGEQVTCLVPKGGALLMRPLLLHASSRAEKPCHRRVIHLEYASEELPGGLQWFEKVSGLV
jgi:ectoine hydroxylase-related dioxygenase (phytanoyl-CoA dioxygenase family)